MSSEPAFMRVEAHQAYRLNGLRKAATVDAGRKELAIPLSGVPTKVDLHVHQITCRARIYRHFSRSGTDAGRWTRFALHCAPAFHRRSSRSSSSGVREVEFPF